MTIRFVYRQTLLAFLGIAVLLLAVTMAVHAPDLKKGTNTIGDTVGDDVNIIGAKDLAVSWWVNQQRLTPNKHAVEIHGADAWRSTDCYNRNGTWRIYRIGNREFHFLCRDDDGSIRDMMFERETNTSNRFDMKNAFTPKDSGIEKEVVRWLDNKSAKLASVPKEIIIYIDGIAP